MARTIKIDADISQAKKAILDLSNAFKELKPQTAIGLFDKDSIKFITENGKRALKDIHSEIEKQHNSEKKIHAVLEDQNKSINVRRLAMDMLIRKQEKLKKLKEAELKIEKGLVDISKKQVGPSAAGTGGRGFRGLSGLGRLPGVGRYLGIGGVAAGIGGAAAGILGAGAAFAIGRGAIGYRQYQTTADQRLALRGRFNRGQEGGMTTSGRLAEMEALGFSPRQTRESQLQATDIFGVRGATPGRTGQRAGMARQYGMDLQQLQGFGQPLRAGLGVQGGNREFMRLMAVTEAAEIKEAIGPWLETAANMLAHIKENGMGLADTALLAMGSLVQKGQFSPERAAKLMSGINQAIVGSTGDIRASFMGAFAAAGIGTSAGIGGVEEAVSTGLFGIDKKTATQRFGAGSDVIKAYEKMGLLSTPGETGKRAGAILSHVNMLSAGVQGEQGVLAKGFIARRMFGLQSGVQGNEALRILEEMKNVSDDPKAMKKLQDKFENLLKSPQEKQLTLMETQEGHLKKIEAASEAAKETLGETIAPVMMTLTKTLTLLDKTLSHLLNFFGMESGEQEIERKKRAGGLTSDEIKTLYPTQRSKIRFIGEQEKNLAAQKEQLRDVERMASITTSPYGHMAVSTQTAAQDQRRVVELMELQLTTIQSLLETQKDTAASSKKTSHNTGKPQNAAPAKRTQNGPGR